MGFLSGRLGPGICRVTDLVSDRDPVKPHNIPVESYNPQYQGKKRGIAYKSSVNLGLPSENLGGLSML